MSEESSNTTPVDERAKIKEIFSSVQGEGMFAGVKQVFIRFCACNLRCVYCDTDYLPVNINDKDSYFEFTPKELKDYIESRFDLSSVHSVSLTGGEPLIWADFLKRFMPGLNVKYYLETNATIYDNIEKIIHYVDIIAADLKLPSCAGYEGVFGLHDKFFNAVKNSRVGCAVEKEFNCGNKNIFAKVVFDGNITDEEIKECTRLAGKYDFELVLQPRMIDDKPAVRSDFAMSVFEKFVKLHKHTRLIPQMHKFLDIE